jgi:replicative DNA helicase
MEAQILQQLMSNDMYFSKAYTHLNKKLFKDPSNEVIFEVIKTYVQEHNTRPNLKEIGLSIKESNKINKTLKAGTLERFKEIAKEAPVQNIDFMLEKTELWVQRQRLTDAIFKSADILQNDEEFEPIIGMFSDALNVSFDTDTGMSYQETVEERAEYYHRKIQGLSTGIPGMDKALGGGYMKKTLSIGASVSHGGKSAFMASQAANMILNGNNILYLTLEMSEEETAKRIDANVLDIDINELRNTSVDVIVDKFNKIKDVLGKLVIKEYAAGTFNVLHLEGLLQELSVKGFVPDAIFIDYIGLMASSRITLSAAGGSYGYIKSIAEELHGFSKKYDQRVITASQLNRQAYGNTEAGLETVSESIGLVQTADVFYFIINSDSMKDMNQVLIKFEKNRNTGMLSNHLMEVDYSRMRYTDYQDENGEYEEYDQEAANTGSAEQPGNDAFDFGSIKF